jgi:hypothetical protein
MTIKDEHIKRFTALIGDLNTLIAQIRKYCPEANYYLQEDTMCLMTGPSHDDARLQGSLGGACTDRVVAMVRMPHADGGAW